MLGTLEHNKKGNWKAHVGPLVHAYNCTRHESTGQSPYTLMFGRNPKLPVDAVFGLRSNEKEFSSHYIAELKDRMKQAHELANAAAEKARSRQKNLYDIKVRGGTVKVGDRVLVKIVAHEPGKHKLADRWEEVPYTVLSQPNSDIPVFKVKREDGEGRVRTLHRNLLLPVGYLSDTPLPAPRKPRKRQIPAKETSTVTEPKITQNDESKDITSDEESEWGYDIRQPQQKVNDSSIIEMLPVEESEETVQDQAEADGDAHLSADTISVQEDSLLEDQRSASQEMTDQDDTLPDEDQSASTDIETVTPVPARRSTRERRPPHRFTTGEYDMTMSAITVKPEWERKVQCIQDLAANSPTLQNLQTEAGKAMLQILMSSTHTST